MLQIKKNKGKLITQLEAGEHVIINYNYYNLVNCLSSKRTINFPAIWLIKTHKMVIPNQTQAKINT